MKRVEKIFNWAVAKSDRPGKRWHNLIFNFIALVCDFILAKRQRTIDWYYKYTNPYGMFSSEDDS